ncbi:MAG: hypothetical protein ABJL54_16010 [Halioglobus sp.]
MSAKFLAGTLLIALIAGCSEVSYKAADAAIQEGVAHSESEKSKTTITQAATKAYDDALAMELERIKSVEEECIAAAKSSAQAACTDEAEAERDKVIELNAKYKAEN